MVEDLFIGALILVPVGWVIYRSPLLTWIFTLAFMLLVCLFAIGCAVFVALAIHIPKNHYWAAAFSLALGVFCSGLVTLPTWEYLVRHIREARRSAIIWK